MVLHEEKITAIFEGLNPGSSTNGFDELSSFNS